MTTTGGPEFQAVSFGSLRPSERDEVRRLAKLGRLSTDPRIAASSVVWANRLGRPRSKLGFALGGVVGTAVSVFTDGPALTDRAEIRDRRTARRIRKIARRGGYEVPPWATADHEIDPSIPVRELLDRERPST